MITLKHNDLVYLDTWVGIYDDSTATVGTIAGHCAERGHSVEEALERAAKHGHPIVWALQTHGVCLYGDRREADAAAERRKASRANAACIKSGDTVLIEGVKYMVFVSPLNVKGPYNSDPIAFVPVKE